jgi:myo-inositol-1(or 4)-monophosphatase
MTTEELYKARDVVWAALEEAGDKLRASHGKIDHLIKESEELEQNSQAVVTALDRDTEKFLYDKLRAYDASIGFRGEEFGIVSEGARTWLVDPIDGTAHFIRGLPFCTSMVALLEDNRVIMSLIYHFVSGDMYWAIKGEGAYCNQQRLRVSSRGLGESILSFESKLHKNDNLELYAKITRQANLFKSINCGFEFSMVASGRLDGRIAKDPYGMDWDFAPGSLLVSEAGGVAVNIGTEQYDYRNHDYLIVNPALYEDLVRGPDALFPLTLN